MKTFARVSFYKNWNHHKFELRTEVIMISWANSHKTLLELVFFMPTKIMYLNNLHFNSQPNYSWWGFSEGILQFALFTILWFKWSVNKHCVAKILLASWEILLHENNRNYNSYIFSYKSAFILFFSFLTKQKRESGFQQVGGVVTRNISVFYL